ncbi:MAG: hypothetical protein U0X75_26540 [Acidobacteriota bacterium]
MLVLQQLVAAARKYNRIVQHGNQQPFDRRLCASYAEAQRRCHWRCVYGARIVLQWRDTIGKKPDGPVPAGVSWRIADRPGAETPVQSESVPLQLALN